IDISTQLAALEQASWIPTEPALASYLKSATTTVAGGCSSAVSKLISTSGGAERLQPSGLVVAVVLVQSPSVGLKDFFHTVTPGGVPSVSVQSASRYSPPSLPPHSVSPSDSAAPG